MVLQAVAFLGMGSLKRVWQNLSLWWRGGRAWEGYLQLFFAMWRDRELRRLYTELPAKRWDTAAALAIIEQCLTRRENLAELHFLKASLLAGSGEHSAIIESYQRCLELMPKHELAAGNLAMLLAGQPDDDDSRELALSTLEYDPHNVLCAIALMFPLNHDTAEARLEFCQEWLNPDGTLRLDGPRSRRGRYLETASTLRVMRGLALMMTPHWKSARADLEAGTELNHDQKMQQGSVFTLVAYWIGLENYQAALPYLDKLVEFPEGGWLAALAAGNWSASQQRWTRAREAYTEALELAADPIQKARSQAALWQVALETDDLQRAESLLDECDNYTAITACLRAEVYFRRQDYLGALSVLHPAKFCRVSQIYMYYLLTKIEMAQQTPELACESAHQILRIAEKGYLLSNADRVRVAYARDLLEQLPQDLREGGRLPGVGYAKS